jgi:hypothetical protein
MSASSTIRRTASGQPLEPLEGAAEAHDPLQARQQDLPQREPVHPEERVLGQGRDRPREVLVQLVVEEDHPRRGLDSRRRDQVEQLRRQAVPQGVAAVLLDADAVALAPEARRAVALVDRDADPPDPRSPCARHSPPSPPPTTRTWNGAPLAMTGTVPAACASGPGQSLLK